MRWLLLCMAIIPLTSAAFSGKNSKVPKAFKASGLSPGIVPIPPESLLNVYYPTAEVCLGVEIPPTRTMVEPKIDYDFKLGSKYTLILLDPDVPSAYNPELCSYICWIVVDIEKGKYGSVTNETIASYVPLTPYPGSGYHRYTWLLYEQTKEIDLKVLTSYRYGVKRYKFSIVNFANEFGLGNPIAGNFLISKIRDICEEYYCTNSSTCVSVDCSIN